jgi:hypothetical protein
MNKKLKTLSRKLNILSKLFDELQQTVKRDTFTGILQHSVSESHSKVLTQRERRILWSKLINESKEEQEKAVKEEEDLFAGIARKEASKEERK